MKKLRYSLVMRAAILLFLFIPDLLWANKNPEFISWELPVTKFSDFGVDPNKISSLIGDGQLVVHSRPIDFSSWDARNNVVKDFQRQRVSYVASVVRAPANLVREMVWDMGQQDDFSPLLAEAKNLHTEGNKRIGTFRQIIKVPILTLESPFVFQLEKLPNGDIATLLIDKGDVSSTFQYWEFFELGSNTTLVVLTGWQDVGSASLSYRILLEAEPALGKVFPLLSLYERIKQFKAEAESRSGHANKSSNAKYDIRNVNSFISEKEGLDLTVLKKLNQFGSLIFFLEPRLVQHEGKEAEVIQVSALQYLPYEKQLVKPYLSGFEGLPEFNEITESYQSPEQRGEEWGHLNIKVNIGPVPVPVHIYVKMEPYGADRYVFFTGEKAYMYPLFGHIEHLDMPEGDGGTLVELTIGGVMGDKASFVFKMARLLPFHNVLIAGTYAMLTADGAGPWVDSKIQAQTQTPEVVKEGER